jgi:3-dehydroquinate dehydratase/shikimate dehydrogenase
MGEIGIPSRILAGKFGAPFTYSTFHHERTLAPGQLSFWQMKDIYHYDEINADTRVYGFIADPIGQSIVPIVHNAAFRALGINSVCVPFRVPREHLSSFMHDSRELDLYGLCVGLPHRDTLMHSLNKLDKAADGIGAVNTVAFHDDRSTFGYNTDHRAAIAGLVRASGVKSENPLDGKRALVLGAGSVAKAVVFGLRQMNADVVITSRTFENARELAEATDSRAVEWDSRYSVKIDILVNCTPVGMHPNVDETPFAAGQLRRTWLVFDTIYNPEQTLLVKEARLKGCRVVTGVDMFIRQVALQFKVFTNQEPPIEVMRLALKRAVGAAKF